MTPLDELFRDALATIDLAARVERALRRLVPPLPQSVRLLAVGKCAPAMVEGALRVIAPVERPLIVTVRGLLAPPGTLRAGHPLPDATSLRAGRAALALAKRSRAGTALVALVSGGASALLCAPIAGLDLPTKRRVTRALLRDGVPIAALNEVRMRLSAVKGGKLAQAAAGARVVTLVASDILEEPGRRGRGHDLEWVGSGPTLGAFAPRVEGIRVAGPSDLRAAAIRQARRLGIEVHALPDARGPVQALAERYAALVRPGLHVAVGEPTVRLGQAAGRGGRSQHLALLVAHRIQGRAVTFLAAGSDGIDGDGPAAGALVDGRSWRQAGRAGLSPAKALAGFDSGRLHEALGTAVRTGPTGLNLLDLHLVLVDRESRKAV